MGTFVTNLHMRVDNPLRAEAAAAKVLTDAAWISTVGRNGWVSLYPAETESQDPNVLIRLCRELSADLQTAVIGFLVHDSDVVMYVLYDSGEMQDEYSNRPDYFGPVPDSVKARFAGRPAVLARYAREGTEVEDIRAFLQGESKPASAPDIPPEAERKLNERLAGMSLNPDQLQQALKMAASFVKAAPPGMIEGMLKQMGLDPNHPKLAVLRVNPEAFLNKLASDPSALHEMASQVTAQAREQLQAARSSGPMAGSTSLFSHDMLVDLARFLDVDARSATLTWPTLERTPPDSGFKRLGRPN